MKFIVDYSLAKVTEAEKKETDVQTTINLITRAVTVCNQDGFDGNGGQRRMFGRMQRKMDEAELKEDASLLDFETAEIELIRKSLRDAKMPTVWSKYLTILEDFVEEAINPKTDPQPEAPTAEAQPTV